MDDREKQAAKWREAQLKAHKTGKNALTFTKVRLNKLGWNYAEFKSKRGFPRDGIVDLIAFKIDKKDHDKVKIILFQIKGGSAEISVKEVARLRTAASKVELAINWAHKSDAKVVFEWEPFEESYEAHAITHDSVSGAQSRQ